MGSKEPFLTAFLVRNEVHRYLPEVLDYHAQFGPLLVLDDHSDDGTYEFCQNHPAVRWLYRTQVGGMWGRESPARQQLWELAASHAEWVYISDADHLLSADPRPLTAATAVNAWAFPLFDLWDDRGAYREDSFWRGHLHPRCWLFCPGRVAEGFVPEWPGRGVHCGHAPANFPLVAAVAPESYVIAHLGYLDATDRQEKRARYLAQAHQLTDFERAHAESIMDPNPNLRILPFAKPIKILVGGPVRKPRAVLEAHLASLAAQELPNRVELSYCFVDDYPAPDEAQDVLAAFVSERKGVLLKSGDTRSDDFSDTHPVTHQWTLSAMDRMGRIKNRILQECVQGDYDFLWLIDSDLVVDRTTLKSMLAVNRPIVSAVYWTRWNNDPRICAAPQVWLKPPYQLALPHYPEAEFRAKLGVARETEKVGGLGACTLIRREVIEKGVNFSKPPNFPSGGLWDGEDRHFCEWARRLHVELWADGWPDIVHIYHPQQQAEIPSHMLDVLTEHPTYPNLGHLVSLKIANLEDGIGPYLIRRRLGDGSLLPELESHVMGMARGQERIVKLHFPSTTKPIQTQRGLMALAGQTRLMQIELVDCKPANLPPILRDEYYVSQGTRAAQDMTKLTAEQHASIAESA